MRLFSGIVIWIKNPKFFRDKLHLPGTADDSICKLKSLVLLWKNKITAIKISPKKRKDVLFVIALILLSLLASFFLSCLFYAAEYGW